MHAPAALAVTMLGIIRVRYVVIPAPRILVFVLLLPLRRFSGHTPAATERLAPAFTQN
jgi:hypothetical protein